MGLRRTVRGSRGSKQVPWVLQPGVMSSAGPCGSNIEGFLRFLWFVVCSRIHRFKGSSKGSSLRDTGLRRF